MSRHFIYRAVAATVAVCTAGLDCTDVNSMEDIRVPHDPPSSFKSATTEELGGVNRYITMVRQTHISWRREGLCKSRVVECRES
jgi:hypothetical protein